MLQKPITREPTSNENSQSTFYKLIDLFYGNWIWRAVHTLVDHPNFTPSPTWIAEMLSISVAEAVDALEGLIELGLVVRNENSYKTHMPKMLIPEEKTKKAFSIKCHKQLTQQLIAKSEVENIEGTMACFVNIDRNDLYPILRDVLERFSSLNHDKDISPSSQLYSINLTCTNLTPNIKVRTDVT